MNTTIMCIIAIYTALLMIGTYMAVTVRQETKRKQNEFDLKLQIAQIKRNEVVPKMSYGDLMKLVRENIMFYTDKVMLTYGLFTKTTNEERSVLMDDALKEICGLTHGSLSKDVLDSILAFVTEDHLASYIALNARLILIAKCESSGEYRNSVQTKSEKDEQ